jgi:hypothetical protein
MIGIEGAMDSKATSECIENKLSSDPFNSALYLSLIDDWKEESAYQIDDIRKAYRSNLLPGTDFWLSWLTEIVLAVRNGDKTLADVC